jgi:hypothetical protein
MDCVPVSIYAYIGVVRHEEFPVVSYHVLTGVYCVNPLGIDFFTFCRSRVQKSIFSLNSIRKGISLSAANLETQHFSMRCAKHQTTVTSEPFIGMTAVQVHLPRYKTGEQMTHSSL